MAKAVVENTAPAFVVEDHGEPVLENGEHVETPDETTPGVAQPGAAPAPGTGVVVEETWSADEAQAFLHNIWNLGFWFYGVDWLAQPFDFKRSSTDAAWVLDRILPKSIGGPVGWTIRISNIASDVAMSAGMRRELIKHGPKSPGENMKELMQRYGVEPTQQQAQGEPRTETPTSPAPAAAPAKKEKPEPIATADGESFSYRPDIRAALDNFPDGMRGTEQYLP